MLSDDCHCATHWCPLRKLCQRARPAEDTYTPMADLGTDGLWCDDYDRWRCDWMIPEEDDE